MTCLLHFAKTRSTFCISKNNHILYKIVLKSQKLASLPRYPPFYSLLSSPEDVEKLYGLCEGSCEGRLVAEAWRVHQELEEPLHDALQQRDPLWLQV